MGVDAYLNPVSTLFGRTESVEKAVANYRIHGANQGPVSTKFAEESLQLRATMSEVTREHLIHWITRLGYSLPADTRLQWSGGWRHRLLDYSLSTIRGNPVPGKFLELVRSPFRSCQIHRLRALYISLLLALVWLLPQKPGLALARRLLKWKIADS